MRSAYLWYFRMRVRFLHLTTWADRMLFVILLLIAVGSFWFTRQLNGMGEAEIYHKGKLIGTYSLSQNQTIHIFPGQEATIKDGKICMSKATCRNQLCVRQGWTSHSPIVCIPNQVLISIKHHSHKDDMLILH